MCLCRNCHEVQICTTHKPVFHMVLSPKERQTAADRVPSLPTSPLSWVLTLLFAPRVMITQSVFNQRPLRSISWLRGRKATDFAQDHPRDCGHTTPNGAEKRKLSPAGTVRNDRPTASYSNSTSVQLWWSVRKPHP